MRPTMELQIATLSSRRTKSNKMAHHHSTLTIVPLKQITNFRSSTPIATRSDRDYYRHHRVRHRGDAGIDSLGSLVAVVEIRQEQQRCITNGEDWLAASVTSGRVAICSSSPW